jgi:glycosyltransferase involved in cell wall biosynthesis
MKKTHILYVLSKNQHKGLDTFFKHPPKNIEFKFKDSRIKEIVVLTSDYKNHSNYINYYTISMYQKILYHLLIIYRKFLNHFNLPIIGIIPPNIKFNYDFILSNTLIISNKKFICMVENLMGLVDFNDKILSSKLSLILIRKILLSNRCKYIFCWCDSAKLMLFNILKIPKNKQKKFITLYPSIVPVNKIIRKGELIKLLFISSINKTDKEFNFFMKGGKLVLQAYIRLKERYDNINLTYIGHVPQNFKENSRSVSGITFLEKVDYQKLLNIYKNSTIFLFPTYGDYFGFTFIEAMAFGLPIICINNNSAANELVKNGVNGYIIKTSQKFLRFPFFKYCPEWTSKKLFYNNLKKEDDRIGLKNLIESLENLIKDEKLRNKLGDNGREQVINGTFSIKRRNTILSNLF